MNPLQRFRQSTITNQANVVFGAIVATATVVNLCVFIAQYYLAKNASRENSVQTEKLISAANKNATAADQFSKAANGINIGISEAVSKLNLQAGALNNSVRQASRLANDTEIANANVVTADRPWIGGAIQVNSFAVGSKPGFTFLFVNTGRRPARLTTVSYTYNAYKEFPSDVDRAYVDDGVRSMSVVVPGAQSGATSESSVALDQISLDMLNSGAIKYFAFAKAEYKDLRTNESFWTHICIRYFPKLKTDKDNGFRNCSEYNDAK